jgi:phage I-like protein
MPALAVLAVALEGDEPPSEFRIFRVGWNETDNGRYLFDEEAARAVMAHYGAHKADRMIDLEHLSIDDTNPNYDPDARGWAKLELRDGELWAVNVTWTDDGARRLRAKTQRYISPVFLYDKKRRPTRVMNIALTAIPATHGLEHLVAAASAFLGAKLSTGDSLNDTQRALAAAIAELYPAPTPDAPCMLGPYLVDVFEASAVYEHDGKLFEIPYTFNGATAKLGAPVAVKRSYAPIAVAQNKSRTARLSVNGGPVNSKLIKDALDAIESGDTNKALEILKGLIASAAGAEPTDLPADPALEGETVGSVEAAAVRLMRETGKRSLNAALSQLETFKKSHLNSEERAEQLAEEQAKLEGKERRGLVGDLVKLGVEIPATAWGDEKGTEPVARLANEPIDGLRDRVAKLKAAKGEPPPPPKPPRGDPKGGDVADLTDDELAMCKAKGVDPAKYAKTRADIRARSRRNPDPTDQAN